MKNEESYLKATQRIMELVELSKEVRLSQDDQQELETLVLACEEYLESGGTGRLSDGWPGDGSGEDDFEDYNQNEGNDW